MGEYGRKETKAFLNKANEKRSLRKIFLVMKRKKLTLSCAESCTGGLLSARITSRPGASDFFLGTIVAYSNAAKTGVLKVKDDVIEKYGAVSGQAACHMAAMCVEMFHSDAGVSVTGIAGPSGGSREKPVGTVWIGVNVGKKVSAHAFHFAGSRKRIRLLSVRAALQLVSDALTAVS
jgi:PncC family amidohydrolase